MNILVCIKQVPDSQEIKINPETHTLIREDIPGIVNLFDTYALEMAAQIKDTQDCRIVVLSMGPEQAKSSLRECLSVGADKSYLINDVLFSGSDTLATSYVLSEAIKMIEKTEGKFDLIFCGKESSDGNTSQVGPELAERLGIPQITSVVEITISDKRVVAKSDNDRGYAVNETHLPCLITVSKPAFEPRLPTIKSKMAAKKAEITAFSSQDLDLDPKQCGLVGSPTKVVKTFAISAKKTGVRIEEAAEESAAKKLAELLLSANLI